MIQKYIVSVPGRAVPLCVAADSFDRDGLECAGVVFRKGLEVVAVFPAVDGVVEVSCLPDFPALSQFKGPDRAFSVPTSMTYLAEPVRGLDPLPAPACVTHSHLGAPVVWPFLSGLAAGALGGVVAMLAYAFV
ncbi:hypothetical protein AB9U01_25275 [Pseudomonas qingdaonensis]|uniref:hypothetical protein n=1 Tax=Pseudomonas qingdaonensis TaxID=2056231 RepID=UPI003514CD10